MNNYDKYSEWLEPFAVRYINVLKWVQPLPLFLRWLISKYIEGHPDASSASNFVARNSMHKTTLKLLDEYKKTFGKEYDIVMSGYSRVHCGAKYD